MPSQSPACNNINYAVWTGTAADGHSQDPHCTGWTMAGDVPTGLVGSAEATNQSWSDADCLALCNSMHPLYCVQQ
jgi:hypothetical protein